MSDNHDHTLLQRDQSMDKITYPTNFRYWPSVAV